MRTFTTTTLTLLALGMAACGNQLVEFPLDDANPTGDGRPDANPLDGRPDMSIDAPPDAASRLTVIATSPTNSSVDVTVNKRVTATFSRAMNGATLTTSTFTVFQGATQIAGTVSYTGTTATFVPASPLEVSLTYTATITTGAEDPSGATLATNHVWTFMTGACGQAPIVLRTAGNFAVLAGATVTNTGPTSVTGDLGVSPGTAVTGFPPGIVNGAQHAGDATAATAIGDLTTAYIDAAGRTLCALPAPGDLGGMTFTPGLYTTAASIAVTSGDVTLDAQGDVDAVFIFQTAQTLTTASGRQVILANGANAANVFWQVGTAATLGTTSVFRGTILADQAITLNTSATLDGRALARIAAVTLASNTIVKP